MYSVGSVGEVPVGELVTVTGVLLGREECREGEGNVALLLGEEEGSGKGLGAQVGYNVNTLSWFQFWPSSNHLGVAIFEERRTCLGNSDVFF